MWKYYEPDTVNFDSLGIERHRKFIGMDGVTQAQ